MEKDLRKSTTILTRRQTLLGTASLTTALVTPAIVQANAPYKRRLRMQSLNSGERLSVDYWTDGEYDPQALQRINWFMRDLRSQTATEMHPKLLDLLWEIDQNTRSTNPLYTMSGYRSPETNARLASRSEGVDENSFHMRGMAMDLTQSFHDPEELYRVARALGKGGAGYYPTSRPFVHVDVGPPDLWVYPQKGRQNRWSEYQAAQSETEADSSQ